MTQFDESGKHRYLPVGEFDQIIRNARQERAVALGNLIADACIWIGDQAKKLVHLPMLITQFAKMLDVPKSMGRLEDCKTAEEVIAYANMIRDREPGLANELICAANRSTHPLQSLVQAEGRLKPAV